MIRALFALSRTEERDAIVRHAPAEDIECVIPADVRETEELVSAGRVDAVVTDLEYQRGALAEFLFLWPRPFVLLVDGNDVDRAGPIVADQFSTFVVRDSDDQYTRYLPSVVRHVVSIKQSVDRHNIALRTTEERYEELVQALPDIVYSLDPDGRFTFVNESVRRLGWAPSELIGRHFGVLLEPGTVQRVGRAHVLKRYEGKRTGDEGAPKLFDERRTGERRTKGLEVILRRRSEVPGAPQIVGAVISYGEVNAAGFPQAGASHTEPGSVGIIRDITARRQAEEQMQRSLREKEMLLAEIHHRVKNNLQVIASLLNLHAGSVSDHVALEHFAEAQLQIQSMALIHEHLYRNEAVGRIDTQRYVQSLCEHLARAHSAVAPHVSVVSDADSLTLPLKQAMPLALLLNELVSNALKHAFPDGAGGTVRVSLAADESGSIEVSVADTGVGMPTSAEGTETTSLGLTLVRELTAQLDGTLTVARDRGTTVRVVFPRPAEIEDGSDGVDSGVAGTTG